MWSIKQKRRLILFLAETKLRMDRGYYWFKYLRDLAIVAIGLESFGLPIYLIIPAIPLVYIIGWLDENKGIWKMEQKLSYERIGQFKKKIFKN